jgi:hypothetical protein
LTQRRIEIEHSFAVEGTENAIAEQLSQRDWSYGDKENNPTLFS